MGPEGGQGPHLERELAVAGGAAWVKEHVEGQGEQKHGAACTACVTSPARATHGVVATHTRLAGHARRTRCARAASDTSARRRRRKSAAGRHARLRQR